MPKPQRSLLSLAFPSRGPVRSIEEPLERTNPDLELQIAKKFVATMSHDFHTDLTRPERAVAEPADIISADAKGRISFQLVEAADEVRRRMEHKRQRYVDALTRDDTLRTAFAGFRVEILALPEQDREIPSPNSRYSLLPALKRELLRRAADVAALATDKIRIWKFIFDRGFDLCFTISRTGEADGSFAWMGGSLTCLKTRAIS